MLNIDKLSEANLLEVLKTLFPSVANINKKTFIDSAGKRMIVDWYIEIDDVKIAVEFDGPTHFARSKTQIRDIKLEKYCTENNILLVRVPYFIQIGDATITWLFGTEVVQKFGLLGKVVSVYENGFIDDTCVLPGDFNPYGQKLFCRICADMREVGCIIESKQIQTNAHKRDKEVFMGVSPLSELVDFWRM